MSTVLNYTRNHEMKLFLWPCYILMQYKNGILHKQKVIVCSWHKRARVSHARTARRIENVGIRQVFFSEFTGCYFFNKLKIIMLKMYQHISLDLSWFGLVKKVIFVSRNELTNSHTRVRHILFVITFKFSFHECR